MTFISQVHTSRCERIGLSLLLVCLLNSGVSLGTSVTISGSSSCAVLNQPFTLTCTVSEAAGFNGLVQLFNKKQPKVAFVGLHQNTGSCSVFNNPPPGYPASCGSGTASSSSTTKKYNLRINSVVDGDATDWWCDLNAAGTASIPISLQISSQEPSIILAVVISILIAGGIGLLIEIFLVRVVSLKKILIKVVLVVGGILLITAIVGAVILGTQTCADLGNGAYLAAAVFCGFGFVVGIILVAVGVWEILKTGKADSGSVGNKPTELHSTDAPRQPLDANNETTNKPPE